ncbi:MAG TPA: phosphoglycerate mutase, partial [Syntrophomonadaceae bacterium]|nr:phosphoglycerate mutase [Syntrophomonadaceae bacterium]
EQVDQLVVGLVLKELASFEDLRILLMPDHRTPVALRTHTSEPVPYMIYDKNRPYPDSIGKYDEQAALKGKPFADCTELMDYFIRER